MPKSYGYFWRNFYFDPHFDFIQMITIPAVWFATIILIIGGPWQQVYYIFNTGLMEYSDEAELQAQAILYGIIYSIAHPIVAIVTLTPIPFNLFLVLCDLTLWFTQLILWQTWYLIEICIWWMDFWYQLSVFTILDYP